MTTPTKRLMSARNWILGGKCPSWKRAFTGSPAHIELARDFAYSLFAGTGAEERAQLIVSELATNAVEHTESGREGGWFGMELTLGATAYIAVIDQGGAGGFPVFTKQPDPATLLLEDLPESGRGLALVEALSYAVGVHGSIDGGATVWARLTYNEADVDRKHHPLLRLAS